MKVQDMVHTWLISNMTLEVHKEFLFMKSVKEVWDTLKINYTWTIYGRAVYRLSTKAKTLVQGDKSMIFFLKKKMDYVNALRGIGWQIDHYCHIPLLRSGWTPSNNGCIHFMGLNTEFETTQQYTTDHWWSDPAAFSAKKADGKTDSKTDGISDSKPFPQPDSQPGYNQGKSKKVDNQDNQCCTYCTKPRRMETCYKHWGRPNQKCTTYLAPSQRTDVKEVSSPAKLSGFNLPT